MTDDEVLDRARADGFGLIERMSAAISAVGWARGGDDWQLCFLEERQAISWIAHRLIPRARTKMPTRSAGGCD
jgi:hypothetical protein